MYVWIVVGDAEYRNQPARTKTARQQQHTKKKKYYRRSERNVSTAPLPWHVRVTFWLCMAISPALSLSLCYVRFGHICRDHCHHCMLYTINISIWIYLYIRWCGSCCCWYMHTNTRSTGPLVTRPAVSGSHFTPSTNNKRPRAGNGTAEQKHIKTNITV